MKPHGNSQKCLQAFYKIFSSENIIQLLTTELNANCKESLVNNILLENDRDKKLPLDQFEIIDDIPCSLTKKFV
jgi:hypothetical protein